MCWYYAKLVTAAFTASLVFTMPIFDEREVQYDKCRLFVYLNNSDYKLALSGAMFNDTLVNQYLQWMTRLVFDFIPIHPQTKVRILSNNLMPYWHAWKES